LLEAINSSVNQNKASQSKTERQKHLKYLQDNNGLNAKVAFDLVSNYGESNKGEK